jgi:hypothetical protein
MHHQILLPIAFALLVTGCGRREDDTCDPTDVPVASPTISQGFAGFGAAPGDIGDALGRVSCNPGLYDLVFVSADAAPADDDAARALLASDAEKHTVNTGEEGYELEVSTGSWLACLVDRSCHLVVVDGSAVTSVHVRSSAGLPSLYAFDAQGADVLGRGYDITPASPDAG